jgi:D-alanine-D-alanine ligase
MSTTLLSKWGIKTPLSLNLRKDDTNSTTIREIFTTFPHPSIVKPQRSGGSVGVSVVHTPQELTNALEEVFSHDDSAHIQEYIPGREVVGCIIKGFRGEQMYTLPILEVKRPHDQQYYSGEHKQHGEGIEFSLDTLTPLERAETKQTTQLAHRLIGLGPYATVDMIVHPRRGIFLLEVNSQPALEETSPFVHALQSVGSSLSQFVEHVIEHARGKK